MPIQAASRIIPNASTSRVIFFRDRLASIIGNVLEHYDNAIFGLLAPFIAPLFFDDKDPLTALILTYGMLPLGLIMRPLGSLYFGWIGDCFGREKALLYSLLGMAITTFSMGCIPTYKDVGLWAPILLASGKMAQSFFASGEAVGGAIFALERISESKRSLTSSLFDASSIGGILLASGLVTFMSGQGNIDKDWRILFWMGGFTAFLGFFLRWVAKDKTKIVNTSKDSSIHVIRDYIKPLFSIILAAGFSYTTYALPLTLMNGYIPLITTLSKTEVMQVNTLLLVTDMILLPCFGYLAFKFGKEKIMLAGAVCSTICGIPLFSLLEGASIEMVVAIRLAIITFGVAFAAPYHAWALERVPPNHRYLILSFGYAIGSQLIGAPSSAICLWLYKISNWSGAPGLYLMAIGMAAGFVVYRAATSEKQCVKIAN